MTDENPTATAFGSAVIRICPACGVVNPSGPSESCPHLQLARFDGVDADLLSLLDTVATARREFSELLGQLKHEVKFAISNGRAEVEAPRNVRLSDIDALSPRTASPPKLSLENPEPQKTSARRANKRRSPRRSQPPKVDPRQLELILATPPKGHA